MYLEDAKACFWNKIPVKRLVKKFKEKEVLLINISRYDKIRNRFPMVSDSFYHHSAMMDE